MQNAVFQLYPRTEVEYKFINRGGTVFSENLVRELRMQVDKLCDLRFTSEEIQFLKASCPYLSPLYLDWLSNFKFQSSEVSIVDDKDLGFSVRILGPWYRTILWEVPLMALISEIHFQSITNGSEICLDDKMYNIEKAKKLKDLNIKFADFGTRRRFSRSNHDIVVYLMHEHAGDSFVGTSNVFLAKKYGLKPIGTHAHEWFMFHAAKYGFQCANEIALEKWVDVFQGDLGIALSDTFTSDNFFKSFGKKYAKLFDGVRHDSGDPIEFAKKTIAHYELLGINPTTKTIIFSDGLNPDSVSKIASFCNGKIGHSYGIGTNLTNDVGVKPLNMVIKMINADPDGDGNCKSTVKLSDEPGKHTGDPLTINLCKETLGL
jgi:nicotinate phosphoribosyltransferase